MPSTPDIVFQQALELHQQGEAQEALSLYQQVIDLDSDYAEAFFYGALLLGEAGQHDKALPWLEKAHDLRPSLPAIAYQLGVCQYSLGENYLAIESFEKVIDGDEGHWQAAYNLGAAYYSSGQSSEAIQAYSLAARLNPQDADIHFNLGLAYKKIGEHNKARDAYLRAMRITPDDADVHYNLGRLYNEMGNKKDATSSFEIAIALRPDFGAALTNLGVLYCAQELRDKAILVYEKLVEIDHNVVAAQHILDALQGKTTASAPLEYVKELYDEFAGHFEKRLVSDLGYNIPLKLVHFLNEWNGAGQSYERMLDLGCGTGLCGQAFVGLSGSMTGVDLSAKMIEKATEKAIYDQLVEDDIVSFLKKGSTSYDLIVAGDVLIYLGQLERVFELFPQKLAEHGRLLFSTEHLQGKGYTLMPTGRYAHSTTYIAGLAQENGLQVLSVKSVKARKENDQWVTSDLYLLGHVR